MVLKKPQKCGGDCNEFVGFGKEVACAANKLVAICNSQLGFAEKRGEGGKSVKKTFDDVRLIFKKSTDML